MVTGKVIYLFYLLEMGCVKSINDIDLKKNQPKPLYAIILTPTRELAMQVKAQLMDVAKYTGW